MSKDDGSMENIASAGRITSRSNMSFSSSSVDDVLDKLNILGFHRDFCIANYPEEAEVDLDAEITAETVAEVEANPEEDEMYSRTFVRCKSLTGRNEEPPTMFNAGEWRLEIERVTPLLKVKLSNDNKDWRIDLQHMEHHKRSIEKIMKSSKDSLLKLNNEVEQTVTKISSRENYINSQFFDEITTVKQLHARAGESKQKLSAVSSNVTELSSELQRVSEDLEFLKSKMDDLGSGMTDSKPLMAIKYGATKIKDEIKEMDLRIGIIENSLTKQIALLS